MLTICQQMCKHLRRRDEPINVVPPVLPLFPTVGAVVEFLAVEAIVSNLSQGQTDINKRVPAHGDHCFAADVSGLLILGKLLDPAQDRAQNQGLSFGRRGWGWRLEAGIADRNVGVTRGGGRGLVGFGRFV